VHSVNKLAVVLQNKHLQLSWLQKAAWSYLCGKELNQQLTDFGITPQATNRCLNQISSADPHSHSSESSSCQTLAVLPYFLRPTSRW